MHCDASPVKSSCFSSFASLFECKLCLTGEVIKRRWCNSIPTLFTPPPKSSSWPVALLNYSASLHSLQLLSLLVSFHNHPTKWRLCHCASLDSQVYYDILPLLVAHPDFQRTPRNHYPFSSSTSAKLWVFLTWICLLLQDRCHLLLLCSQSRGISFPVCLGLLLTTLCRIHNVNLIPQTTFLRERKYLGDGSSLIILCFLGWCLVDKNPTSLFNFGRGAALTSFSHQTCFHCFLDDKPNQNKRQEKETNQRARKTCYPNVRFLCYHTFIVKFSFRTHWWKNKRTF